MPETDPVGEADSPTTPSPPARRPASSGRRSALALLAGIASLVIALGGDAVVDAVVAAPPGDGRGGGACRAAWRRPVEAPVLDPFRPPDHRYGPGNRGIQYATADGDRVVAVDAGVVAFAGPVGGRPVVAIEHGADLRSTYTNLVAVVVGRGDLVAGGQPVAEAAPGFHLGARRAATYLDPAGFIERRCVVVRLVA
ncbi:MAG: peptidoglycan DD-metalloendopeptidase family protein [Actinomycetota bacterium]